MGCAKPAARAPPRPPQEVAAKRRSRCSRFWRTYSIPPVDFNKRLAASARCSIGPAILILAQSAIIPIVVEMSHWANEGLHWLGEGLHQPGRMRTAHLSECRAGKQSRAFQAQAGCFPCPCVATGSGRVSVGNLQGATRWRRVVVVAMGRCERSEVSFRGGRRTAQAARRARGVSWRKLKPVRNRFQNRTARHSLIFLASLRQSRYPRN